MLNQRDFNGDVPSASSSLHSTSQESSEVIKANTVPKALQWAWKNRGPAPYRFVKEKRISVARKNGGSA